MFAKYDLESRCLWRENNPYTFLTLVQTSEERQRSKDCLNHSYWMLQLHLLSWLFMVLRQKNSLVIFKLNTNHCRNSETEFWRSLSISKWFWGNSCRWTTLIGPYTSNLSNSPKLGESAHGLSQGWVLVSVIISWSFLPCSFYFIAQVTWWKECSVSHCEEFLSYFCEFMIKFFYVTASASLQRGWNTGFFWDQVEYFFFFACILYLAWW